MDWVDWGDAPGWFALLFSGVAAFYAIRARGDSRRSADAAEQSAVDGKRSADAAEQSVLDGRRAADAATRSAQADESALQIQQDAAQPVVALAIRPAGRSVYRLVNDGTAAALNTRLHPDDVSTVQWVDPLPSNLEPGDSCEFVAASPANRPGRLRFTWDGQAQPVNVQWP